MAKGARGKKGQVQEESEVADLPAEVIQCMMSRAMLAEAVKQANIALRKFKIDKDIASHLKKYFDQEHKGSWSVFAPVNRVASRDVY